MAIRVPKGADETWFNDYLRGIFASQNLRAAHIRETDRPGFSDLLVWDRAEILGFVELKIDGKPLEVSQREFMRERDAEAGHAFVFTLNRKEGIIHVFWGVDTLWAGMSPIE